MNICSENNIVFIYIGGVSSSDEDFTKKYTNGNNNKRYYEKNKDKIKEQGANYLKKLSEENPEKLREYRRNAYLKRATNIKGNWKDNKYSPNNLAINILW